MENTSIPTASEAFLGNLRMATTPMHKQLEANSTSAAILTPEVTLQQYAKYLAIMREVIAFTENKVFPIIDTAVTDLTQRHKLAQIDNDIAYLKDRGAEYQIIGNYHPLDANVSLPFALGFMYVIEGSTLGGRVILKHIHATLGLDENNGAQFFAGYAAETGKLWKSFLQQFTEYTATHQCEQEVIAGAQLGFKSIDEFFVLNS